MTEETQERGRAFRRRGQYQRGCKIRRTTDQRDQWTGLLKQRLRTVSIEDTMTTRALVLMWGLEHLTTSRQKRKDYTLEDSAAEDQRTWGWDHESHKRPEVEDQRPRRGRGLNRPVDTCGKGQRGLKYQRIKNWNAKTEWVALTGREKSHTDRVWSYFLKYLKIRFFPGPECSYKGKMNFSYFWSSPEINS